jgi:hypothetical protein
MRRHHIVLALSLVALLSFSLPAVGAPSPLTLAKKAFKSAKKANKRAKKANKRAKNVDKRAKAADARARQALEILAGPVPSARTAASLENLVLVGRKRVAPSASAATEAAARDAAQPILLMERGQLSIYAKCFTREMPTPRVQAEVYIGTAVDGTIVYSSSVRREGPNSNGFLLAGDPEANRQLAEAQSQVAGQPSFGSDPFDQTFNAMSPDGSTLSGMVLVAARHADALAPEGAYGPGSACHFAAQAWVLG